MTHELTVEVESRLHRERNVWLGTLRADGSPHITPVWFVYEAGRWWIGSEDRSVKVRNVLHDPRVSLALQDGDSPVVAEGDARVHRTDFPHHVVQKFAAKYGGWDISDRAHVGSQRVLIEVSVGRWLLTGKAR